MFQPARPSLTWSSDANLRARLYGSLNVVDAVPMSPIRWVAIAIAVSSTVGSSERGARWRTRSASTGPSARNTASKPAFSAICAICTKCRTWMNACGSLPGSRHPPACTPRLVMLANRCSGAIQVGHRSAQGDGYLEIRFGNCLTR